MNRAMLFCLVLIGLLLNKPSYAEKFPVVSNFIRIQTKANLLGRGTVQRDLELTDEQIKAVHTIIRAEILAKAAVREQRLDEYSKDALTAAQLARLEEIYVQTRGAESLLDPTIARGLGISDVQKVKLDAARKKYIEEHGEWAKRFQDRQFKNGEEVKAWVLAKDKARQAVMQHFEDAAMSILKPEQLDHFKKLRGKPIDFGMEGRTGQTFSLRPEMRLQEGDSAPQP